MQRSGLISPKLIVAHVHSDSCLDRCVRCYAILLCTLACNHRHIASQRAAAAARICMVIANTAVSQDMQYANRGGHKENGTQERLSSSLAETTSSASLAASDANMTAEFALPTI
eukprot:6176484-Pleurochrysis_carterae.AAC.3